jgi:hypothetical protein
MGNGVEGTRTGVDHSGPGASPAVESVELVVYWKYTDPNAYVLIVGVAVGEPVVAVSRGFAVIVTVGGDAVS